MRMAVDSGRLPVCCPASVCDTSMRIKGFGQVDTGFGDKLLELCNLAHLLEGKDLILLITIDCKTGGVITSVL